VRKILLLSLVIVSLCFALGERVSKPNVDKEIYLGFTTAGQKLSQYIEFKDSLTKITPMCSCITFDKTGEKELVISVDTTNYSGRTELYVYFETTRELYRYKLIFDVS